ncbi:hypothetical protein ACT1UE_000513 [Pseudomonas aeruginosa]
MNKALDLLREIRPSIPKEVLELWCKDRDAFLASHPAVEQAGGDERATLAHRSEFHQHLKECADEVATWPSYKREALTRPSPAQAEQPTADDYEEVLADHRRLVREMDVLLNGEACAAKQAMLCDLVSQVEAEVRKSGQPLLVSAERYRWLRNDDNWGADDSEGKGTSKWANLGELSGTDFDAYLDQLRGSNPVMDIDPEHSKAIAKRGRDAIVAQAEAERPEVVARVVHSNPIVLGQCGPLNANDELMTVAQHAASVARWAEMFNRVEQERDVALARVAELERQEPVDVPGPGPDEIHQMAFEEGQPAEDGDGYLFSAEEFDLFVQRLLDSCATPVAWAQHSVPEGWMLVECGIWTQEQVDEMQKTVTRFRNSEFVDDRALAMAVADAGQCKAPEISLAELLATAPGKEVPQAWIDVQAERRRQITAEGWTPEHDDLYCAAELPRAAAAYILNGANDEAPAIWPFVAKWWKPRDARSNYVRAGALILAEIERLDRAAPGKEGV